MGNIFGAERSVERKRPTDLTLKQLNDSVWEFYSPEEGVPDVEIIFFHGLQLGDFKEAFWTTWLALEEECVIWPKEWLSEILPKARILSIDYSSSATDKVAVDSYLLGKNLVCDIIGAHIGENCPVTLVGHCLGGIVIKHFLVSLKTHMYSMGLENYERRISKFFENFQGVFFYATPHGDSPRLEALIGGLRQKSNSPYLKLLEGINQAASRVNAEYQSSRIMWRNAHTYAVSEGYPTTYQGFDGIVVSESSARQDVDNFYTVPMADHFTVCRARSQRDPSVIGRLVQFIVTSNKITVSKDVDYLY